MQRAPDLTCLDLHNNKLTALPDDIAELKKLMTLKISNNDLSDLNPRLALLPKLVRISIEGNPLKCIKSSLREAGAEQLKKYLKMRLSENEVVAEEVKQGIEQNLPGASMQTDAWDALLREFVVGGSTLELKNRNLNFISPKLWLGYPGLLSVDFSENPHLNSIPEEFGNLLNLKQIRFQKCNLKSLPMSLLQLRQLNTLDLANNQLTSFFHNVDPSRICLTDLTYLSLNGNFLTQVPDCLKHIPSLQQLHLHQNKISDISELCRSCFARLQVLDLGSNKIREVPIAFVYFLAGLTSLTLANNDLEKVPPLLGHHKNLRTIQLDGNPLKTVRRAIIDKGSDAVLKYLKDRYVQGQDDQVEDWALARERRQTPASSQLRQEHPQYVPTLIQNQQSQQPRFGSQLSQPQYAQA